MRPFQTGDIVRDQSLDEIVPEHLRDKRLYRVVGVSLTTEWQITPLAVCIDGEMVMQQFLTLEVEDGNPSLKDLAAQEAFTHRGPRYEVVKSVEEIVAEVVMGNL